MHYYISTKNFKESSLLKGSDLYITDVRQIHYKFIFLAHRPAIDKLSTTEK